jgi:hypothetical protein
MAALYVSEVLVKVKSLVKIISHVDGGFHLTFFRPIFSLFYAAMNKDHALAVANRFVLEQLQFSGKDWIQSSSKNENRINCPEGCIKLPEDIWCCKLSDTICDLQANIEFDNTDNFLKKCSANEQKKLQILKAVESGKYDGFHHVPDRLLCVSCADKKSKKESFKYHYPWEFAEIDVSICSSYEETLAEFQNSGIPERYVNSPICSQCCYELAVKIRPELKDSFHVIESNFNPRS